MAEPVSDRPPGAEKLKVTVIVPCFRSTRAGLEGVIASLESQTMPQQDFEWLFNDDGSDDDTLERLEELAGTRPTMRVASMPNSGWPSRPRNIGVRMARGEYVVFMDHDDYLYPRALADAYAYATEHRLDSLSAKEVKTSSRFFAWAAFQKDVTPEDPREPQSAFPMTPHKMYRRDFLLEQDIVFPEGGPEGGKVQWEDVHFNIDVFARAERIGVLSSRPFYQWIVGHGSNNSSSYAHNPDEYWQHLEAIFDHLDSSEMDQASADWIRASNFGNRVLSGMLGTGMAARSDEYNARVLEHAESLVRRRVPERVDALQTPVNQARAHLLRSGRTDLLPLLAEHDRGVRVVPVCEDVRFAGGRLHIQVATTWVAHEGSRLPLGREEGRLVRTLPLQLAEALTPSLLDVDDALKEAATDLTVTGRASRVSWPLPTTGELRAVDGPDGVPVVGARPSTGVDLEQAGMGWPLEDDVWLVGCHSTFMGYGSHPLVKYDGPHRAALVHGRFVVACSSTSGQLLVDVGGRTKTVLARTRPDLGALSLKRTGPSTHRLLVPLRDVAVAGETRLPVVVRLRPMREGAAVDVAGAIVGDTDGARLEVDLTAAAGIGRGRYRVLVDDSPTAGPNGKRRVTDLVLGRGRGGRFSPVWSEVVPARRAQEPRWSSLPRRPK
jgi:hypothetical protein